MKQHMRRLNALLLCPALGLAAPAVSCPTQSTPQDGSSTPSTRDRYVVKVAAEAGEGQSGRLILFFVPDTQRWEGVEPSAAPFFDKLQPIASMGVPSAKTGDSITVTDADAVCFAGPLDGLSGSWRVQAVLDTDFTTRGHLGPGNLVSESVRIDLDSDRPDEIRLELTRRIPVPEQAPTELVDPDLGESLVWIERKSPLLSAHAAREFRLRAGVVLPYGYHDLAHERRIWPTIYVIGGFGATHRAAADAARALTSRDARAAVPQAVWVFLDTETAWGHHGFCDSETNGPVGRALVEEFVPFLEERFRLVARPEARIVTGHSSGGWTALHLALTYPDTFGACFASAPDPVDFSALQRSDLYRDASLFLARDGGETPSLRAPLGPADDRVLMTVRDEVESELAIDPRGRSGQQWAAWEAMWSPYDAKRGGPRRICDPATGAVDPVTAEAWSRHDIARMLDADPRRIADLFATRIRLLCGSRDSFYLNEAVERLRTKLEAARAQLRSRGESPATGPGSIDILEGLTHDTLHGAAQLRFYRGIIEHLRTSGLADPTPRSDPGSPRPE